MSASFSYSVTTKLPRERVWSLLTDISNWSKVSDVYSDLRWVGTPWEEGSAIVGQINFPMVVTGRYVIKKCDPPLLIRYLSQTRDAGFATERTITLEQLEDGTEIRADAYVVGRPKMPGGAPEFLKSLTTRWFDGFAAFCDNQNSPYTNSLSEKNDRALGIKLFAMRFVTSQKSVGFLHRIEQLFRTRAPLPIGRWAIHIQFAERKTPNCPASAFPTCLRLDPILTRLVFELLLAWRGDSGIGCDLH